MEKKIAKPKMKKQWRHKEQFILLLSLFLNILRYLIRHGPPNYYVPLNVASKINIKQIPEVNYTVIFNNNTRIRNERVLTSNIPPQSNILLFKSNLVREYLFLYHIQHAYVGELSIIYNNSQVDMPTTVPEILTDVRLSIDVIYTSIVYLFTQFGVYGHRLTDGIVASLINVPKEIYEKSYVATRFNYVHLREFLDLLDIKCKGTVELNSTFIQCDNVYIVKSYEEMNGMLISARDVRDKMYEVLNLSHVVPKLGAFSNRKRGKKRYISNMKAFMKLAQTKYKDVQFIEIKYKDLFIGIKDMFTLMSNVKYLITPAGSSAFNILFMKNNTGCCIIGSNIHDWADYGLAHVLNVWLAYCSNSHISHDRVGWNQNIDLQRNMIYFDRVVYAVEHSKWPAESYSDRSVKILFNLDITKKIMEKNPYLSYSVFEDEEALLQQIQK